jgi:glycerol kinase
MRVLALDQGTSATKAVVFEEDGAVVSSAEAIVTPEAVAGGGVEQDPEQLWESVCAAGREAVARAGGSIDAVGFANQGETVLAWDRQTGRPLGAALSWQDRRAAAICADMADHAAQLTRITGLPLDPYFAAPKMAWLRQHGTTNGVVTTSDSWLLHRLTGAYVTDVTTASRTLLLDLGKRLRTLRPHCVGAARGRRLCGGDRRHRCLRPLGGGDGSERGPAGGADR